MLVIRFSRVGKRNHAQYKVVVAEKTAPIKGRFVEQVGSYDPHLKISSLKEDRIKHWISNGAICSDSVHNLLVKEGTLKEDKRPVKIRAKKKTEGEEEKKEEKKSIEDEKIAEEKEESKEEAQSEEKKEESKGEEKKEAQSTETPEEKVKPKEEKSEEPVKEESEPKKEEEKKE